ncbi:MAG: NINE protein [Acidobacteriota bacterium]|nr:NINE protein [Acidobacteriota bacterium]
MFCTNCGSQNEAGTAFCTKCGTRLGEASAVPPEGLPPVIAGSPEIPAAQPPGYVPGYPQQPGAYGQPAAPYQDPTAKSKLVAGLLGILLGGLGIHRFYLGYTNIGIAQLATDVIGWVLLPFTCGISLVFIIAAHVWGLVDGIMILTGSINQDALGKPLRD